jgi:hypothetical protein
MGRGQKRGENHEILDYSRERFFPIAIFGYGLNIAKKGGKYDKKN